MKKLSKKQKIIAFIAILIVAVLLETIITTSILKNNNQVANEGYATTSANAGSNLIANYILNGITIGGITGKMDILNTNDATARAEDILAGKVAYARGERIVGTMGAALETESYVGNYADINDDGTVDGVIFADLAVGGSGEYGTNGYGTYTIPKEDNLKSYYIKSENYTDDSFKKSGKVIAPIEEKDESKKDRFYVMALEDFNPGTFYYWYFYAYGILDNYAENNDFGEGRTKTKEMIEAWNRGDYGTPVTSDNSDTSDMWGSIQTAVENIENPIWFVPSKSEWAAFEAAFEITSSNYSNTYGLNNYYWSSSQYNRSSVYIAACYSGSIRSYSLDAVSYVRLATTF